jgi:hypothetical protein
LPSRFLVAGYTGSKHGVYYEAGFAPGLNIPVFPTCGADNFDQLQFERRHINTLKRKIPSNCLTRWQTGYPRCLGRSTTAQHAKSPSLSDQQL